MEAQQMNELALNARIGHWPPHLGLTTNEQRIEHLAAQLDEASRRIMNAESLADENQTLREERDDALNQVINLRDKIDEIHNLSTPPRE